MVLVKRDLNLLVLLLLKACINANPLENVHDLDGKVMKLLSTCFTERTKAIITTSDTGKLLLGSSWDSGRIPLILMDKNFEMNTTHCYLSYMATFIFSPKSVSSFEILLQTVKFSPWWHIDALFFIIGNSRDGCRLATPILERAWKMNLLFSLFLCQELTEEPRLYTYNPYTNRAPHPWKEFVGFNRPDNRWTLYMQQYSEGLENCRSLNFDKTEFMDGYEIRTVANAKHGIEWTENKNYNINSLNEKHTFIAIAIFWQNLFPVMNMTAIVNYDYPGYFHNGEAVGFLAKLINRTYDISLSGRYIVHNLSSTYPFIQTSPRILTQQQNFLLPEEKILSFYSTEIKYLTGIVLLITFIFLLVVNQKEECSMAALDVLRMLLSTVILVSFDRLATRIFFFGVFQLVIIINATFQGHLSAFLTKPERHYVNTMKDLQNYNVHAPIAIQDYLDEVRSDIRAINYLSSISCIQHVVNDSSIACIQSTQAMLGPALKYKLHISLSKLPEKYLNFWCRDDWPLKQKFDHYTSRLIEAGLYGYLLDHNVLIPLRKLNSREIDETSVRYRPIKLVDLAFAFRLLAICVGTSTLVFITEMIPWQKFLRVTKTIRNRFAES